MHVIIARHYMQLALRNRSFVAFATILIGMTIASGVIGLLSHQTIISVYNITASELQASGKAIPPNPFASASSLSLIKNMMIYIPLVGALIAIIIGNDAVAADRSAGVAKILFSRPINRAVYVRGKLLAASGILGGVLGVCLLVSCISLAIIIGHTSSVAEYVALIIFYFASFMYLLFFVLVGMISAMLLSSRLVATLSAIGVWVMVTFILPQIVSGVSPVASLNPVSQAIAYQNSQFFQFTSWFSFMSFAESYKHIAGGLLGVSSSNLLDALRFAVPITAAITALYVLTVKAAGAMSTYEGGSYE